MRMREPEDRGVVVPIACCPPVALVKIYDLSIRTQLDHAKGQRRARESVAVSPRADQGINLAESQLTTAGRLCCGGIRWPRALPSQSQEEARQGNEDQIAV